MKFVCPKCSEPLCLKDGGCAVCGAGHSYDRSRDGYYNLLLGSGGGLHGDNREMVEARRRFLQSGAYEPLMKHIEWLVTEYIPPSGHLIDVGCGEGYYTLGIAEGLAKRGIPCEISAFDISKDAVKLAARASRRLKGGSVDMDFAVASAYNMPIAECSADVVTNVFSPLALSETVRVLRHGGRFIMAIPDENHLFALKKLLYSTPYKNEVSPFGLDGLRLCCEKRLAYEITLNSAEDINALFMMTPYAYRTPKESRERLLSMKELKTEIEFIVLMYEKP